MEAESAPGPPVRPGVYALSPIAAVALHLRMLDSFEVHQIVKRVDKQWFLGFSGVWVFGMGFGVFVAGLPPLGRFLAGKPVTGELTIEAYVQFAVCVLGAVWVTGGFFAPFILALVVHSFRMHWAMKRLTGLVAEVPEDHSTWVDTRRLRPARVAPDRGPPTEAAPSSRRRRHHGPATGAGGAVSAVPAAAAASGEEGCPPARADHGPGSIHRFARPFVIDCRFDGSVNGFHELRRWVPYSHQRVVKRLEWVFVSQLVFVLGSTATIAISTVSGNGPTLEEELPIAGMTVVAVLSLGLYLIQATGHNELLITHTHLIREQERGVYRDAEACTGTGSASLAYSASSRAGAEAWTLSPTSDEAHRVRQHTATWPGPLHVMRAVGDMYSAEAGDRHVGPKMRFAGIVIDRSLLRVILSTLTSAVIFLVQQAFSFPFFSASASA
jgi:hypothetical protein